jgi:hypothetical protein
VRLAAALLVLASAPPVVPWTSTPPPRAPAHPSLAAPCLASQLRPHVFLQGATGSLAGGIELTNVSTGACSLVGTPRVSFAGATSKWRPGPPPKDALTPRDALADPVGSLRALAPGKTADVGLWWSNWCGHGHVATGNPGRPPSALLLGLGHGTTLALRLIRAPRCDDPSAPSVLSVGAYTPVLPQLPRSSELPLRATIAGGRRLVVKGVTRAALRARPGATLAYTVVLTNRSGRPFRFAGRCPSYVESVATAAPAAFVLNCSGVGEIAPHGSVRFAMRVHVPAADKSGLWLLTWSLAPHSWNAPTASMLVVVR